MRPLLLIFAATCLLAAALAAGFIFAHGPGRPVEAVGPSAPNQMALDADTSTSGVQSTREVSGITPFEVGLDITQVNQLYTFYQFEIEFPTNGLAFMDHEVERTSSTGLLRCFPLQQRPPLLSPTDTRMTVAGCEGSLIDATAFVGEVAVFQLQCLDNGSFPVSLLDASQDVGQSDIWWPTLVGFISTELDTGTSGALITCTNVDTPGVTVTPSPTPTATPCAGPCPTATPTRTPGPNVMALDADPSLIGRQASRTIFGTAPFFVDVDVASTGATPYFTYQWEIEFATGSLAYVFSTEHEVDTGLGFCAVPYFPPPLDPAHTSVGGGCNGRTGTLYVGAITTLELKCLRDGTLPLTLLDANQDPFFGSTLMRDGGGYLLTQTQSASITCQTSATATPTKTATATPTRIALIRVGGIADVEVRGGASSGGQDARSGGSGASLPIAMSLAAAAVLSAAAAGALYLRKRLHH